MFPLACLGPPLSLGFRGRSAGAKHTTVSTSDRSACSGWASAPCCLRTSSFVRSICGLTTRMWASCRESGWSAARGNRSLIRCTCSAATRRASCFCSRSRRCLRRCCSWATERDSLASSLGSSCVRYRAATLSSCRAATTFCGSCCSGRCSCRSRRASRSMRFLASRAAGPFATRARQRGSYR
jgi:hypothetical protein